MAGCGGWLGVAFAFRSGDVSSLLLFEQVLEMPGPETVGALLPFPLHGGLLAGRVEEAGVEGLVRRGLDAFGQGGCGSGGVLRFVAADTVAEGVVGDRPGTAERIARR